MRGWLTITPLDAARYWRRRTQQVAAIAGLSFLLGLLMGGLL